MLTQRITQDIMKELHKPHFSRPKEQWDPNIPIIYFEETHTDGKEYDVPLVILRTNPCKWCRRQVEIYTFCSFPFYTSAEKMLFRFFIL
jgi:uncharacterized Fe-S cluster-containing MiaB family protein